MNSLSFLAGKRVPLTGSACGIGFLLARGLAEAGAEVIINATIQQEAEESAAKLRARQSIRRHPVSPGSAGGGGD